MAVEMLRGPDHIARRSERVFMNGGDVRPLVAEGKRGVSGSFWRRMKLRWRPPSVRHVPVPHLFEASGIVADRLTRWRAAAVGRSESAAEWPSSRAFERPHDN